MPEKPYLRDLDASIGEIYSRHSFLLSWLRFAFHQMQEPLRGHAAQAFKEGKSPGEIREQWPAQAQKQAEEPSLSLLKEWGDDLLRNNAIPLLMIGIGVDPNNPRLLVFQTQSGPTKKELAKYLRQFACDLEDEG